MIFINLSHPFTDDQKRQIEAMVKQPIRRTIEQMAHFDDKSPFAEQIRRLIDGLGLTSADWQTEPLLLNPPGLSAGAVAVLAEIHGRCGYFVPIVHIRPIPNSLPPRYEVAEILNLQAIRANSREQRD